MYMPRWPMGGMRLSLSCKYCVQSIIPYGVLGTRLGKEGKIEIRMSKV